MRFEPHTIRQIPQYLINIISCYLRNRTTTKKLDLDDDLGYVSKSYVSQDLETWWNFLYDGVLGLKFVVDATINASADDLAVVVVVSDETLLMNNANKSVNSRETLYQSCHRKNCGNSYKGKKKGRPRGLYSKRYEDNSHKNCGISLCDLWRTRNFVIIVSTKKNWRYR